jgi:hypothetical protein
VEFVSVSASQGTATRSAGSVTASLGTLDVGATATITIVVRPTVEGTISNSAVVQCDQATSLQSNATVEVSTTVIKAPVAPPAPTPPPAASQPPTVVSLRTTSIKTRKRGRAQSAIVVTYSEGVVPAGATALGIYRLVAAGRHRRFGTSDDRAMSFRSATYDPGTKSVTLVTSGRLNLKQPQQLTITSSAVVDLAHNALDGNGDGTPGGDYIGLFGPAPRAGASKHR